ncbi:MAG: hypothetical protein ACYDH5_19535 [Acidimicrobiales bacterium]
MTSTATPTAKPIWRTMVTRANPVAMCFGGSDAVAVEKIGGSPTPTPSVACC